jgi:hypothetical protein
MSKRERGMAMFGPGSNVYSLRAARNRRPLTAAELAAKARDDQAARVRWLRVHVDRLAAIAGVPERTAEDLVEAARLREALHDLLDLQEPEAGR